MKRLLTSLLMLGSVAFCGEPVVMVESPGLLGNGLFAYCMAKIIAENMGWKVYTQPIWGFPNTYSCVANVPSPEYPRVAVLDAPDFNFDVTPVISDKSLRNIHVYGYFQSYEGLKPYTDQIRQDWFKIAPELLQPKRENSIVVHVRAQYPPECFLPFEYYQTALETASYDQVYICTDDPAHPFLANFNPYNPIIVSTRNLEQTMRQGMPWPEISKLNMDDFLFMLSFDKIISSYSTYSWWAAFLSEATEIYAPYPTNPLFQNLIVDEERYHYIETQMGP